MKNKQPETIIIKEAKGLVSSLWDALTLGNEIEIVRAAEGLRELLKHKPVAVSALTISDKGALAFQLRLKGESNNAIQSLLQYGDSKGVNRAISKYIDEELTPVPDIVDHAVSLELARYDNWLVRLQKQIVKGGQSGLNAIHAALKVSKARRELLGLDAPVQSEVLYADATGRLIKQLVLPEVVDEEVWEGEFHPVDADEETDKESAENRES
jgi:hypothetical protein